MNLKVVCSSIHYLDCDFYLQDVFSLRQQFFTTLMPHTGVCVCVGGGGGGAGGGGRYLNKYQVLNNNLNAKKMQYSVASNQILLCHADHYNV